MDNPLIELFFPRFCVGCGYVGTYLCHECERGMRRVTKTSCFYCGGPSSYGLTHPACKRQRGVDGHLSVYLYGGVFKKLLHESKYKGAPLVLNTLLAFPQEELFKHLYMWNSLFAPTVSSVPLHPQRERERGHNQATLIMDEYFIKHNFLARPLLERIINTKHLASMENKQKRRKHIQRAFRFIGESVPKTTILIDDVITSGSTIMECAKTLKGAGVQTVLAFSLAKG